MVKQTTGPGQAGTPDDLPSLPLEAWQDTCQTLHLWVQMVGKVRQALSPMVNHWWQVTLYLSPRGLTTGTMPSGREAVQIDFDLIDHLLKVESSTGERRSFPLAGHSVADFYRELMAALQSLGVSAKIWDVPVEVEDRTPFHLDHKHASYDPEYVQRFWRVLLQADRVMKVFRGRFTGKASPVHLFGGSFDLASARFSGRRAPKMTKAFNVATYVMTEAYFDEVSSCGFWPGEGLGEPAFYAYTYPEPPGYQAYPVKPAEAYYHSTMKEYILPYAAVRAAKDWEAVLLSFFQSTYEAGANLGKWDREALEQSYLIKPEG